MPFTLQLDRPPSKSDAARPSRRPAKTRDFSVRCLGILAGSERPSGYVVPLWMAFCETRLALEPFVANLRSGWIAKSGRFDYVFPKAAGFRWSIREIARDSDSNAAALAPAAIAIAYRPAFFDLEPRHEISDAAAASIIQFVLAPPSAWIEREALALATREPKLGTDPSTAKEAVRAAHFAAYLDRRTPLPLLADLRFHLALFRAARERRLIRECEFGPSDLWGQDLDVCGIADPLLVRATPDEIAQLITQVTESFAQQENLHGTSRRSRSRGLLPDPFATPTQHCFDFAVA